jgi:hypothetical protein
MVMSQELDLQDELDFAILVRGPEVELMPGEIQMEALMDCTTRCGNHTYMALLAETIGIPQHPSSSYKISDA